MRPGETERSFAHLYDTGGMRRTHLRGHTNILKRVLIHAGGFNLGLVMRQLIGAGTPRGLQGVWRPFSPRLMFMSAAQRRFAMITASHDAQPQITSPSTPGLGGTLRRTLLPVSLVVVALGIYGFLHVGSFLAREDALQEADAILVLSGTPMRRPLEAADLYTCRLRSADRAAPSNTGRRRACAGRTWNSVRRRRYARARRVFAAGRSGRGHCRSGANSSQHRCGGRHAA